MIALEAFSHIFERVGYFMLGVATAYIIDAAMIYFNIRKRAKS